MPERILGKAAYLHITQIYHLIPVVFDHGIAAGHSKEPGKDR